MPILSQRRHEEIRYTTVYAFVGQVFGEDMHAKRVESLASATLGSLQACSLAVSLIGQGLAQAHELNPKHATKQVDRLFSNRKLDVWTLFSDWVPYVIGERTEILTALDWTEFDSDGHSTLMLSLLTHHGRATPLIWKSVKKATLKGRRNDYEREVLARLKETLPEGCRVTVLADRGFCDTKLYQYLTDELHFDYVIRFRDNIHVEDANGISKPALHWVEKDGRLRTMRNVKVTEERVAVPTVVLVRRPKMKEAWCLVSSREDWAGSKCVEAYGGRWEIESRFRDIKDDRFGMGLADVHTESCARRDRMILVGTLAIALLTLLGMAGEAIGLERTIKANTVKRRTYSLFNQGTIYYGLLPGMKEERAVALMEKFNELLSQHRIFRNILGIL